MKFINSSFQTKIKILSLISILLCQIVVSSHTDNQIQNTKSEITSTVSASNISGSSEINMQNQDLNMTIIPSLSNHKEVKEPNNKLNFANEDKIGKVNLDEKTEEVLNMIEKREKSKKQVEVVNPNHNADHLEHDSHNKEVQDEEVLKKKEARKLKKLQKLAELNSLIKQFGNDKDQDDSLAKLNENLNNIDNEISELSLSFQSHLDEIKKAEALSIRVNNLLKKYQTYSGTNQENFERKK